MLVIFIIIPTVASAQDDDNPEATPEPDSIDCPAIVQTAIDLTQQGCSDTGNNEVCYGHLVLDAQPRANIDEFDFQLPGDVVDVIELESLRLSGLDTATGQWGVVLMQIDPNVVQQNIPNTDADVSQEATETEGSDDVQVLLFGDVELADATQFIQVRADETINIRRTPSTGSEVLDVLEQDEIITVNGRLEDSTWLRVRVVTEEESGIGWIFTDLVTPNGNENSIESLLPISEEDANSDIPDELALYGPMQAFVLETGNDDSPCDEAPNSGILIQTPEGVASVSIWLDEVIVELDDTAFIQAQADGSLTVNVLSGTANVEALGEIRTAVAGQAIGVPLGEDLAPTDVPNDPVPIDAEDITSLPVELLDTPVELPTPLAQQTGVPVAGSWQFSWGVESLTCPDSTEVPFESTGGTFPLTIQSDGIIVNTISYNQTSPGVYQATYTDGNGNLHQDTLQVVGTDRIQGEKILDLVSPICTLNVPFQITLISGN